MLIQDHIPLASKTTMHIGGNARYYAELKTKEDVEQAWAFAKEKNLPFLVLGAGSNTVFTENTIEAVVAHVVAQEMKIEGQTVTAQAGIPLASLLVQCAKADLDLSALTGIPGTFGGALVGNAGQGPKGVWLDSFVQEVNAFVDGEWKTFTKDDCRFRYRESIFKEKTNVVVWDAALALPPRPQVEVMAEMGRLLKKRIETQPHRLTAGSCFKGLSDGTPAWKLIEAAGLRGTRVGGIQISDMHANFLINADHGTFADLLALVRLMKEKAPGLNGIEMRLIGEDGKICGV